MGEETIDILNRLCPHPDLIPNTSKLTAAFALIQAVPQEQRTPGTGWYNQTTGYEFYKLLVSSLIAYANALRILFQIHKQLDEKRKAKSTPTVQSTIDDLEGMLPDCAEQLLRCIHILWIITDSHILCHHLKLLQTAHLLHQPFRGAVGQTKVFGRITPEWTLKVIDTMDDGEAHDEEEEVEEDDEDQSEVFRSMNDDRNLDKSILKWMQLQVSHIISMQKHYVSLAIVKYPSRGIDRPCQWESVLESLHFPADFDVQAAINAIKDQVQKQTISRSDLHIFSPDQLPSWLPSEMVTRCKAILRDEVIKMMAPQTEPDASQQHRDLQPPFYFD